MPTEPDVLNALRQVEDPDLKKDIVSLGFIKNLAIQGEEVSFDLELTTPACPLKDLLKQQCHDAVAKLPGVKKINIKVTSNVKSNMSGDKNKSLSQVKNIIAIASGKGGVGKSTVAANLALALAKSGAITGLLDADIYGPSIPTMFGIAHKPDASAEQQIIPIEKYGVKLMSMGFLSSDDTPIIWRGPMVHGAVQQFLTQVAWGRLDYLVIDLPPGTGDAQLTLVQLAAISGAVIVTTPQEVSLIDARKGLKMFQQVNVPVLGIIENLSYYICPGCGKRAAIFREGGGRATASELKVPFLGEIPIASEVSESGDVGEPILVRNPDAASSKIYQEVAGKIAAKLSIASRKDSNLRGDYQWTWKTVPT